MKPLALFTFTCFLLALGARFYALNTTEKIQKRILSGSVGNPNEDIFKRPTTQLIADLKQLEDVIDKETKNKNKKKDNELSKVEMQSLREEFEKNFTEPNDNLVYLKQLQDQLRRLAEDNDIEVQNTETLDIFVIFYFMIHERLSFDDINSITSFEDYFVFEEDKERIETYLTGSSFLQDIYEFKNIPMTKDSYESFKRSVASVDEKSEDGLFDEYIKVQEAHALNLEAEFADDYVDEELVREKLKRIHYNDEQISEVIHGYEQVVERY